MNTKVLEFTKTAFLMDAEVDEITNYFNSLLIFKKFLY